MYNIPKNMFLRNKGLETLDVKGLVPLSVALCSFPTMALQVVFGV